MLWKTLPLLFAVGLTPINISAQKNSAPDVGAEKFTTALLRDSVPESWSYVTDHVATSPADDSWWETFGDPVLSALIKRGEERSFTISETLHRIEMARLNWETARAAYFPTVGVSAGWTKAQSSGMTGPVAGTAIGADYFSLGLNFAWEIDLFGKVRDQSRAAKASFDSQRAQYTGAMISLSSNIATAYFNYRLAQLRVDVAQAQIASQQRITKITEARHEAGLASKLDVAQSLTVLYSTQASLPSLINMRVAALNNIALLVGCYPDEIKGELEPLRDLPIAFQTVSLGVPADLLRRRPDVLQAEYQLAGYAAQLGVAKKDFLPTLSLQGSVGTSAHRAGDLFSKESLAYSISPQLSWTIFEGMARNRRLASAKEQMQAGIDNYNMVVMNAVLETENALAAYDASLHQISLYRKVLNESREVFDLAVDRYKKGLAAFTDVMDAQINTLNYENTLLQTRAAALISLIKLYTAVAGAPFK